LANITAGWVAGQEKAAVFCGKSGDFKFCGEIKVRLEVMSEKIYIYEVE
jgi:hypothetical protein